MKKFDTHITMRIEQDVLDSFKTLCGKNYQGKIRELMRAYVEKYDKIEKREKQLRSEYLNVNSYVK